MAGASRQQTFDLVPETLIPQNAPKKAMTMKQAKKAAAMASRTPRMSRAERARLEKEELDRQRKERDKHRASEKAKAAREKKAAKLAEEKAQRKKLGIPEPSKYVRSSQQAISGFVTTGFKRRKTEEESDNESEGTKTLSRGNSEERELTDIPPVYRNGVVEEEEVDERQCNDSPAKNHESPLPQAGPSLPQQPSTSPLKTKTKNNLRVMCKEASEDCDEFDDDLELFAAMAESIVELPIDSPRDTTRAAKDVPGPNDGLGSRNMHSNTASNIGPRTISCPTPITSKRNSVNKAQVSIEGFKPSLPSPVVKPLKASNSTSFAQPTSNEKARQVGNAFTSNISKNNRLRPLSQRSVNMPPPPPPHKRLFDNRSGLATPARKQAFAANLPPSSTQNFLRDNLEDFFPSPTQELRELRDEEPLANLEDFFPTPTQEMRELKEEEEADKWIRARSSSLQILTPTVAYKNCESATPSLKSLTFSRDLSSSNSSSKPASKPRPKTRFFIEKEEDNVNNRPKARFFMEKEEDIAYATLMTAGQETPQPSRQPQKRKYSRIESESSDYGEEGLDWNSQEAQLALEMGEYGI